MTRYARLLAALLILAALLAATAIIGARRSLSSAQATLPPMPEKKVDRIAYVTPDGAIRAIRLDAPDEWQVSPLTEGFFTWPTWSPDAKRLVFSGVTPGEDRRPKISLYAYDAASGRSREIYAGEPGVATLLAEGVVHYPLWSPDSSKVAFIAGTSRGLTLFIDDLKEDLDVEFVLDSGPLWMSWSPDSSRLLVHRGDDHFLVSATDGGVKVDNLGISASGYRVPAWTPRGHSITVASEDMSGGHTIYQANLGADGTVEALRPIRKGMQFPVFLWSPDGEHLAVADASSVLMYQGFSLFVHQGLTLVPADAASQPLRVQDNVLAYFWSPDGAKVAYVTLSDVRGALRWMVMDSRDGQRWPLVDFIPSADQLTVFQFFDQYAYSHSPWSPEGDALVFAGILSAEAVTASLGFHPGHLGPHVIVTDAAPGSSARVIADGFLAFWSPR